jgi:hypothetical protein
MERFDFKLRKSFLGPDTIWFFQFLLMLFNFLFLHELRMFHGLFSDLIGLLVFDRKYERSDIGLFLHLIILFKFNAQHSVFLLLLALFIHALNLHSRRATLKCYCDYSILDLIRGMHSSKHFSSDLMLCVSERPRILIWVDKPLRLFSIYLILKAGLWDSIIGRN